MFEVSQTFFWVSLFAVTAAVINGLGILTIFRYKEWAEKVKPYLMCFAAGVLVSTPLLLILPNGLEKNPYAGFLALIGFLFMYFSNLGIRHKTKQKPLAFGITAAEGIGIHSLVDGIIYAVTFSASIFSGLLAGIGLIIHEFAEGIITYLVLIKSNISKRLAMWYAFLIASLTTPIGAFLAFPFISKLSSSDLGLMMGFVAGVLLYVSAAHLLPEAREHERQHSSTAFLGGVILALFIVLSKTL